MRSTQQFWSGWRSKLTILSDMLVSVSVYLSWFRAIGVDMGTTANMSTWKKWSDVQASWASVVAPFGGKWWLVRCTLKPADET